MFLIAHTLNQEIKAGFRFCDEHNTVKTVLDIKSSCHLNEKINQLQFFYNKKETMAMLIKAKHAVYGRGFQCN